MKTVFEHIEYVKGKPHHIRKRVAFSIAAGVTALTALVWLSGSLATGAFAIGGDLFGEQALDAAADNAEKDNGLAGAAAALPNVSADEPARIEIIDSSPSLLPEKQAEQTVLPF